MTVAKRLPDIDKSMSNQTFKRYDSSFNGAMSQAISVSNVGLFSKRAQYKPIIEAGKVLQSVDAAKMTKASGESSSIFKGRSR